jgi:Zn finger protein HypA/HybF involved in hydrogenase expression
MATALCQNDDCPKERWGLQKDPDDYYAIKCPVCHSRNVTVEDPPSLPKYVCKNEDCPRGERQLSKPPEEYTVIVCPGCMTSAVEPVESGCD